MWRGLRGCADERHCRACACVVLGARFWKGSGPVFLMLGGESSGDPIWATVGTWHTAAQAAGVSSVYAFHAVRVRARACCRRVPLACRV